MTKHNRVIVRLFIKTVLILEALNMIFTSNIAFAQDDVERMTISPQPVMSAAWESAKYGAMIGFGSGAAVSLIGYAANAQNMDYGRVLAGTTGSGFMIGAVYGIIEAKFFNENYADLEERKTYVRPQVFERESGTGYGLLAALRF